MTQQQPGTTDSWVVLVHANPRLIERRPAHTLEDVRRLLDATVMDSLVWGVRGSHGAHYALTVYCNTGGGQDGHVVELEHLPCELPPRLVIAGLERPGARPGLVTSVPLELPELLPLIHPKACRADLEPGPLPIEWTFGVWPGPPEFETLTLTNRTTLRWGPGWPRYMVAGKSMPLTASHVSRGDDGSVVSVHYTDPTGSGRKVIVVNE